LNLSQDEGYRRPRRSPDEILAPPPFGSGRTGSSASSRHSSTTPQTPSAEASSCHGDYQVARHGRDHPGLLIELPSAGRPSSRNTEKRARRCIPSSVASARPFGPMPKEELKPLVGVGHAARISARSAPAPPPKRSGRTPAARARSPVQLAERWAIGSRTKSPSRPPVGADMRCHRAAKFGVLQRGARGEARPRGLRWRLWSVRACGKLSSSGSSPRALEQGRDERVVVASRAVHDRGEAGQPRIFRQLMQG